MRPLEKDAKVSENPSKPYHVGIHLKDLAEYSQKSSRVPEFQSFFKFFTSFCTSQISHMHAT